MSTLDDFKQVLKNAGILGAGGAGFPSFAKLAEGADILLINGAECEPLLYTDYMLMRDYLPLIVEGAQFVLKAANIDRCYICIKDHNCHLLGLVDEQELAQDVRIRHLPDAYPMGDEVSLICEATGRLVQPGHLPITQHVIVFNIETVLNIRNALVNGAPVTEKYLTINGDVDHAYVVKVPVGMRVSELFDSLCIRVPENDVVLDGGPSMGQIINPTTAVITKTTKSLLILPESIPAIVVKKRGPKDHLAIASSVCCQCSRCTDLCPRHALGYPLEPHKHVRVEAGVAEADPSMILSATLCCGCGICELGACCQYISPRAVIQHHKAILAKNRMRYVAPDDMNCMVREEHPYTAVSTARWKDYLGVTKYDKEAVFYPELKTARRVEIPLPLHIGAPSVPAVKEGDMVSKGQIIGNPGEGLSLPAHASLSGKVIFADNQKIIIEEVKE